MANISPSATQDTTKLVGLGKAVGKGGVWGKLESPALSKEVATAEHQPGTALWPSAASAFNFLQKSEIWNFMRNSSFIIILVYLHLLNLSLLSGPNLGVAELWVGGPTLDLE